MSNKEQFKNVLESILDFVDTLIWKPEDVIYYPTDQTIVITWDKSVAKCWIKYVPDGYYPEWEWNVECVPIISQYNNHGTCLSLAEAYQRITGH